MCDEDPGTDSDSDSDPGFFAEPPQPPDPVDVLLHTLWSKAVGSETYDKSEWILLQHALWTLKGYSPIAEPDEPEPWSRNGTH
jgi:hypothetical protein